MGKRRTKLKEKWKMLERGCRRDWDSRRRGSDANIRYPALAATVLTPHSSVSLCSDWRKQVRWCARHFTDEKAKFTVIK